MLKYVVLIISLLLPAAFLSANDDPAPVLTEDNLRPMCSNEQVWSGHGVSTEQCMEVATECANRNETRNVELAVALQSLYDCIFNKLNIQMHHR